MLTENHIAIARNWVFTRPDSHHHDGYSRLRRRMMTAGVDLPVQPTRNPCQTERELLVVYFDAVLEAFGYDQQGNLVAA